MALALRSGLPLQDMEFYQFHPTGLHKLGIVVSEAARVEGGVLRNVRPMRSWSATRRWPKDLAPRDIVSRAIDTELREGRGSAPGDHVLLDLTQLPSERWGSATATAAGLAPHPARGRAE